EPLPDGGQVARKHPRRGDDLERHPLPHSRVAAAAKRRHAALRRHARPRQHEDMTRRTQALAQPFVDVRLLFDGHRIEGMVAERVGTMSSSTTAAHWRRTNRLRYTFGFSGGFVFD